MTKQKAIEALKGLSFSISTAEDASDLFDAANLLVEFASDLIDGMPDDMPEDK